MLVLGVGVDHICGVVLMMRRPGPILLIFPTMYWGIWPVGASCALEENQQYQALQSPLLYGLDYVRKLASKTYPRRKYNGIAISFETKETDLLIQ